MMTEVKLLTQSAPPFPQNVYPYLPHIAKEAIALEKGYIQATNRAESLDQYLSSRFPVFRAVRKLLGAIELDVNKDKVGKIVQVFTKCLKYFPANERLAICMLTYENPHHACNPVLRTACMSQIINGGENVSRYNRRKVASFVVTHFSYLINGEDAPKAEALVAKYTGQTLSPAPRIAAWKKTAEIIRNGGPVGCSKVRSLNCLARG